ncbi:MAG TPA: SIMPL domain-containing protein [Nitrososphaera sp.]|nr:SIMPL domain-containing protein [Nitrososphaera sp.]
MSNHKINQKKVALIAGILAAALLAAAIATQVQSAAAQTRSDEDERSSTITTSGTATAKVEPDKFSVTAGVETNGTTAEEAASANAELAAKVIAALKDLGIAEQDIATSSYYVYPVYEERPAAEACIMIYPPPPECMPRQVITGYRASSSLTVTLDADGQIDAGEVIDAAVSAGANTVSNAYYFLSTELQQQVRDRLIVDAIANARHRADIAAKAAGMEVSGVESIYLNDVYIQPFPVVYRGEVPALESASSTPILPGQQEVTMTVNMVFSMQ